MPSASLSAESKQHELLWSLFCSAATSYRVDTLLRPFPPEFISEGGQKEMDALKECVETMPSPSSGVMPSERQRVLLEWLLSQPNIQLTSKPISELTDLRDLTGERWSVAQPDHLFEVDHNEQRDLAFQSRKGDHGTFYAFHGSKVENFYSIVSHGLHSHLNKTSLYGEGTYLSTEPTVALGFSPWGKTGWKNSEMAESLSILALCEVIDHPSVKRLTTDKGRRKAPNSEAGDVPDKYVVVTNNDMVRVKYLLVYAKKPKAAVAHMHRSSSTQAMLDHAHRHGHSLTIALYVLLLAIVSVASSPKFWRRVRQLYEDTMYEWAWSSADTTSSP